MLSLRRNMPSVLLAYSNRLLRKNKAGAFGENRLETTRFIKQLVALNNSRGKTNISLLMKKLLEGNFYG